MKSLSRIASALLVLCWVASETAYGASEEKPTSPGALDIFLGNHPQFFKLLPFNIPVIRDGNVISQVSMIISIETFGLDDKDKVIAARRKLQNAFIRDLYGVISVRHGTGRPFVAESVKFRLTRLAKNIVGQDVVKSVLIESVYNMQIQKR